MFSSAPACLESTIALPAAVGSQIFHAAGLPVNFATDPFRLRLQLGKIHPHDLRKLPTNSLRLLISPLRRRPCVGRSSHNASYAFDRAKNAFWLWADPRSMECNVGARTYDSEISLYVLGAALFRRVDCSTTQAAGPTAGSGRPEPAGFAQSRRLCEPHRQLPCRSRTWSHHA
jgi:hypothetical protein